MTSTATKTARIPSNIVGSLHRMCNRYKGGFKSMKQRKFLVSMLAKYALHIETDLENKHRTYTVRQQNGQFYAFRVHGRHALPHVQRKKVAAPVVAPAPVPAEVGPALSAEVRAELAELLKWGPSEFIFLAPSAAAKLALVDRAKLDAAELSKDRSRATDEAWTADDLEHVTRVQIAAKGLLCEIGDNAGTSAVSMSAADAAYVSQMITEGHIRNAHWFQRKTMTEKALRKACIVNKAKMPAATQALAQRMVDLMNDEVARLGRPVSFGEYVAIMGADAPVEDAELACLAAK